MAAFGSSSETIDWAIPRLTLSFKNRYPRAAEIARSDARNAVELMEDITLIEDARPQVRLCQIDATYDPEPPTIRWRSVNARRDNFTLLHEVAHHLLAHDEDWCYDVAPRLGDAASRRTEEVIADAFAADVLIDEETARDAFRLGVTSKACVALFRETSASATACLARALREPGERLVLLTDLDGYVYFSATTGEPYSPGRRTRQPAIASGAERALEGDGSYHFSGGDGIHYRSGTSFTAVRFDLTVEDRMVFALVEQAARTNYDYGTFDVSCEQCDEDLRDADVCTRCREPKCARCHMCSCPRPLAHCDVCFIQLPVATASAGRTLCDNCG